MGGFEAEQDEVTLITETVHDRIISETEASTEQASSPESEEYEEISSKVAKPKEGEVIEDEFISSEIDLETRSSIVQEVPESVYEKDDDVTPDSFQVEEVIEIEEIVSKDGHIITKESLQEHVDQVIVQRCTSNEVEGLVDKLKNTFDYLEEEKEKEEDMVKHAMDTLLLKIKSKQQNAIELIQNHENMKVQNDELSGHNKHLVSEFTQAKNEIKSLKQHIKSLQGSDVVSDSSPSDTESDEGDEGRPSRREFERLKKNYDRLVVSNKELEVGMEIFRAEK